ncbi:hypothetical protein THAOC_37684 [Thalassiosira oceanica]|uniref:Uncharacterized protein n=1 Tax=Thalassiosira oceanica TaxID=159749 RepID=K0QZQ4_THAOC|nr:hypothetical protein THAOC_37684 [Thalassiosira oceanica]|eukprot:EJK43834.1 hypothetical protein THAOC_37684 [Thalassiosira oceanica]
MSREQEMSSLPGNPGNDRGDTAHASTGPLRIVGSVTANGAPQNSGARESEPSKVRNGETEKAFETFVSQRESYAQYCLDRTPGNRGLHGSSMSEQGHSSALSFLNDGKKDNSYFAQPVDMISKLLKRQKHHTKKTDALLFGESQKLTVEESHLKKEPDTRANNLLLRAVQILGLREYERFKCNLLRTAEYATEYVKDSISDEVTCTIVRSTRHPDAPPRYLRKGERCDCKDRIAEQDMCVHEICCDGFDQDKFLPRHLRRDRVSGSLEGWSPPESSASPLDEILKSNEVIFDPPAPAKDESQEMSI